MDGVTDIEVGIDAAWRWMMENKDALENNKQNKSTTDIDRVERGERATPLNTKQELVDARSRGEGGGGENNGIA